jgi:glycosyltransferase involved in cell wall biosynthesis
MAASLVRIANADRVIALKFPAYLVEHDEKVVWLLHQFRQVYDFWGTPLGPAPTEEMLALRDAVMTADNRCFSGCRSIFAISPITADRLKNFNGFKAELLLPPLTNGEGFHCTQYGDYLFLPSRINESKRQRLVVEAMRYVQTGVKLVVAGFPESSQEHERLRTLIGDHGLGDQVRLVTRFVTEEEKVEWLAGCLACPFTPYDEDYGYVALEAFKSSKPVVTTTDAGGANLFVRDGETGYVVPPDPVALAGVFDDLFRDRDLARRLGLAGHDLFQSLDLSWGHVVEALTR